MKCQPSEQKPDLCCTVTVKDVYGKPFHELEPPEGHEFTGEFSIPNGTSLWFTSSYNISVGELIPLSPRLALRKKTRKRFIFEPTGRLDCGPNEYWQGHLGFTRNASPYKSAGPGYTMREEEY